MIFCHKYHKCIYTFSTQAQILQTEKERRRKSSIDRLFFCYVLVIWYIDLKVQRINRMLSVWVFGLLIYHKTIIHIIYVSFFDPINQYNHQYHIFHLRYNLSTKYTSAYITIFNHEPISMKLRHLFEALVMLLIDKQFGNNTLGFNG